MHNEPPIPVDEAVTTGTVVRRALAEPSILPGDDRVYVRLAIESSHRGPAVRQGRIERADARRLRDELIALELDDPQHWEPGPVPGAMH